MDDTGFELLGATPSGRKVWIRHETARPLRYTTPFGVERHALLLWDAAFEHPDFPNAEMNQLAEDIVAAACVYSMSSGFNASAWDDLIDGVHVEAEVFGGQLAVPFTLTAWQDPKPGEDQMDEAIDFFIRHMDSGPAPEDSAPEDSAPEDLDLDFTPVDQSLVVCLGGSAELFATLRQRVLDRMAAGDDV